MRARYKYRIYPTKYQQTKLAQLFGCVRVVWNDSLACCKEKHAQREKKPTNSELQKQFITSAKKTEHREWLSEVSAIPLQQSLNDLNQAYQNFFQSTQGHRKGKPVKPPKFKKRKSKQTARFTKGGFKVGQDKVYLAKIGKLKIVWSRDLPATPSSATVIKDSAHRYFLSFVVEIQPEELPQIDNSVGIDLGIKTFATLSNGEKVDAPKPLKKRINKYRKLSKSLSHKTRGSKRHEKARLRVAKFNGKLKDTRTDFLHKLSTKIIRENQTIVLEDLNVSGMLKNRKLSRANSD
ncbi:MULTISPECIES: RNA-guided endonuclease TnpB family protein [unclassified Okeania]|uniref:RNA-guided endonuclease InsQ/TnpB family protein n=1 Tax=unclassified Okeania TaxID=2634635 RepID=UPI00338DC075